MYLKQLLKAYLLQAAALRDIDLSADEFPIVTAAIQ